MGKFRDAINKRLEKEAQDEKRKNEVSIYDSKKKERYYPSERREAEAKKKALVELRERNEDDKLDSAILKSMSDRVNNAEGEEHEKAEERLSKHKDAMRQKKGGKR